MPCTSSKIGHPTRQAAIDAQKQLVWLNHARGEDARSIGLNAYPCQHCYAWHVGHLPQTPTVFHYTRLTVLTAILAHGLKPHKPHRLAAPQRRRYSGARLAQLVAYDEIAPLT